MTAALSRRLAALEGRKGNNALRYVVMWGEHDASVEAGDRAHVVRIAWVKPDRSAWLVLPHNGRDDLPPRKAGALA